MHTVPLGLQPAPRSAQFVPSIHGAPRGSTVLVMTNIDVKPSGGVLRTLPRSFPQCIYELTLFLPLHEYVIINPLSYVKFIVLYTNKNWIMIIIL